VRRAVRGEGGTKLTAAVKELIDSARAVLPFLSRFSPERERLALAIAEAVKAEEKLVCWVCERSDGFDSNGNCHCNDFADHCHDTAIPYKAEEQPQTHDFVPCPCGCRVCMFEKCRQLADAPIHQTGGK
jgi:hypothetical protein